MESFKDYSRYVFNFDRLDKRITRRCSPDTYYQRWMRKYAGIFNAETTAIKGIEWDLRCKKSLREMFASATFFVEAKKDLKMRCYASYYFCLYYSLFHALWAVILMDSETSLTSILNITHQNLINTFTGSFANSGKDILDKSIKDQFYDLQYKREYYSYVTPINNLFKYEEDLEHLKESIHDCFQLASFHSLMIEKSYDKNVNKLSKIGSEEDFGEFIAMFESMFSKRNAAGRESIDPAASNLRDEIIEFGSRPEYIALVLDHQYDELHTYDGFDWDKSVYKDAVIASEIYSIVYQAINQ